MRVALYLCLVLAACKSNNDAPPPSSASVVRAERPLDAVRLTDATGAPVQLRDRLKDVTLLVFWASWCGPCQAEMPLVDRYAASEKDPRISILAVNIDENRQDGITATAARHYSLPVVFDPDSRTYEALFHTQDAEIPAIAVVSADGVSSERGYESSLSDDEHIDHFRELAHAHLR